MARWNKEPDKEVLRDKVSVSSNIWARYVKFEGVEYVAALANEPDKEFASLLHAEQPGKTVDVVYVAEDHLGIRQLLFGNSTEAPSVKERSGIWWRPLPLSSKAPELIWQTDVSVDSYLPSNRTNFNVLMGLRRLRVGGCYRGIFASTASNVSDKALVLWFRYVSPSSLNRATKQSIYEPV